MLVGTHTLMPVCACLLADHLATRTGRDRIFPPRSLWVIGVFGALPDLCTPHLSLEDRYTSWSHTVWFVGGLIVVAAMVGSLFENGSRLRIALACWLAAFLHVAADAISGGTAWLHPWRTEIIGRYYIPPQHWMWFDAFFILFAWLLVRLLPYSEARGIRMAREPENP